MNFLHKSILLLTLLYGAISHAVTSKTIETFLVISDIHLNATSAHTMDFSPRTASVLNDLDVATYQKMIHTLSTDIQAGLIAKPKFILLLGDLVGHRQRSTDAIIASETIVFETLKQEFPDTPVLYDFGNNDSLVENYGPFQTSLTDNAVRSPVDVMKKVWPNGGFLSSGVFCARQHFTYPCLLQTKNTKGYYSAYLDQKLRLIALNSVLFSKQSPQSEKERDLQLAWIKQELDSAERNHESVLIAMHIPPGYNLYRAWFWSNTTFWMDSSLYTFMDLLQTHHTSVIGGLAGHTHKDELKIVQDTSKNALMGIYINPALSSSHGNAPAVRSYELQQDNTSHWNLTNYQTYYFTQHADNIKIKLLYDFRKTYCSAFEAAMTDCLDNVSLEKMQSYFSAGNPHYVETIKVPENRYLYP
ncbi:MAG: hypothetical protein CK424_00195 [Legionella sp.]|nr:MAG: hypothetical protein CK424_00195 [Legionella sp.]